MKRLAELPIRVPENPFWKVSRRFGRDELVAMVVNVLGTAVVSFFTANPFILSIVGPVVEKVGFFPAHFKDALVVYNTTSFNRKSLSYYLKQALKGGFRSLLEDVLIHDPMYFVLMYVGVITFTSVPAWMLATISFIVAVIVVAVMDVGATELRYLLFKRRLKREGFGSDTYFESRFYMDPSLDSKEVLDSISHMFALKDRKVLDYRDIYIGNGIPNFSDRVARIRLRSRTAYEISSINKEDVYDNLGMLQSVQVVFTRSSELRSHNLDSYRLFPVKKEKFYFFLEQGHMPAGINDIADTKISKYLTSLKNVDESKKKIAFRRYLAKNNSVLVSVDESGPDMPYLLEVKSYNKTDIQEVMRYILMYYPVSQTTYGKSDIVR